MEQFKDYKLIDTTKNKRFRDTSKERKMIVYCDKCKIADILFEASTIYRCFNCDQNPKTKILE